MVESLSDSTIYHAYYTVCHLLHSDFYGKVVGPLGVSADEMTDAVWDYIFCRTEEVPANVPKAKLDKLKGEFRYFYPLDLSVSAKDLVGNHLTMFLYVNEAVFPKEFWPKGIRINGHLLLNGEKMSKSTGNFLTLRQMLTKYGSDASRIALADAGDSVEDANFDENAANAAILRLHNLKEWLEQVLDPNTKTPLCDKRNLIFDDAFNAEMDEIIIDTKAAYDNLGFRQALKRGLFDLQICRDYYRDVCNSLKIGMSRDLIVRYAEVQALLITPIAPHFSEFIYRDLLKKDTSIQNALFPEPSSTPSADRKRLIKEIAYIRDVARSIRETEGQLLKKKKKGPVFDAKKPSKLTVYLALQFPEWQAPYIDLISAKLDSLDFKDMTSDFKKDVSKLGDPKRGMQLVNTLRLQILAEPETSGDILGRDIGFDEPKVLKAAFDTIKLAAMATNVTEVQVIVIDNGKGSDLLTNADVELTNTKPQLDATPGRPGISIVNLE